MPNTKKLIIFIACILTFGIVCFCSGIFIRLSGASSAGGDVDKLVIELRGNIEQLNTELERRIAEVELLERQSKLAADQLYDVGRYVGQSGLLIGQLGTAVSDIDYTSANAFDIIRQLRDNQSAIAEFSRQLQSNYIDLTREYYELKESLGVK